MGHIRNLALEGGGIKGIAYVGFLLKAKELGIDLSHIQRIAGTSAGSIVALLLSLNYSPEEIEKLYLKTNFSHILGAPSIFHKGSQLFHQYGYYKGEALYEFIKKNSRKKYNPEMTFENLHYKKTREHLIFM